MPAEELWMKVDITNGSIDYLLGPVVVDVDTIVDVIAEVSLHDGRAWRVRVMTGAALIATVDRWLHAPVPNDVLAFPDLMVVENPGIESMSTALDLLTSGLSPA